MMEVFNSSSAGNGRCGLPRRPASLFMPHYRSVPQLLLLVAREVTQPLLAFHERLRYVIKHLEFGSTQSFPKHRFASVSDHAPMKTTQGIFRVSQQRAKIDNGRMSLISFPFTCTSTEMRNDKYYKSMQCMQVVGSTVSGMGSEK